MMRPTTKGLMAMGPASKRAVISWRVSKRATVSSLSPRARWVSARETPGAVPKAALEREGRSKPYSAAVTSEKRRRMAPMLASYWYWKTPGRVSGKRSLATEMKLASGYLSTA